MDFKELASKLSLETENPIISQEELQGIVDDYQSKDNQINDLTSQLSSLQEEHEKLKNKIVDSMFNNDKKIEEKKKEEEPKPKTFKDIINPNYLNRNNY